MITKLKRETHISTNKAKYDRKILDEKVEVIFFLDCTYLTRLYSKIHFFKYLKRTNMIFISHVIMTKWLEPLIVASWATNSVKLFLKTRNDFSAFEFLFIFKLHNLKRKRKDNHKIKGKEKEMNWKREQKRGLYALHFIDWWLLYVTKIFT